jgi:hypothetical protein
MTIKVASFLDSIKDTKPFNTSDAGRNALLAGLATGGIGAGIGAIQGLTDRPQRDPQTGERKSRIAHVIGKMLQYGALGTIPGYAAAASIPALAQNVSDIQGALKVRGQEPYVKERVAPLVQKLYRMKNENKTIGDIISGAKEQTSPLIDKVLPKK